jgi:hypothetical protein
VALEFSDSDSDSSGFADLIQEAAVELGSVPELAPASCPPGSPSSSPGSSPPGSPEITPAPVLGPASATAQAPQPPPPVVMMPDNSDSDIDSDSDFDNLLQEAARSTGSKSASTLVLESVLTPVVQDFAVSMHLCYSVEDPNQKLNDQDEVCCGHL